MMCWFCIWIVLVLVFYNVLRIVLMFCWCIIRLFGDVLCGNWLLVLCCVFCRVIIRFGLWIGFIVVILVSLVDCCCMVVNVVLIDWLCIELILVVSVLCLVVRWFIDVCVWWIRLISCGVLLWWILVLFDILCVVVSSSFVSKYIKGILKCYVDWCWLIMVFLFFG